MTRSLVEQVTATLCRLADAPPVADVARTAVAEIESASRRVPLTLGVGGELPTRTSLFNDLCEDKLFDPYDRAPGCAAVRLRRGSGNRFHAIRADGSKQVQDLPLERPGDVEIVRAAAIARAELEARRTDLVAIDRAKPAKPPWWAFWRWLGYFVERAREGKRRDQQRRLAEQIVLEARVQFEEAERAAAEVLERTAPARESYIAALRGIASGGAAGVGFHEVIVEVGGGMLPEGVEVLELTGASRSSAEVDAVAVIEAGGIYAPGALGARPRLGSIEDTVAALPLLLASARSLGIARRYRDKIRVALDKLDALLTAKEDNFRQRITALEAMRIADIPAFVDEQLARIQPQIIASVNAVLEHASVHLASELSQVASSWIDSLARATSGNELAAAVAKIDDTWTATLGRAAEETRLLAMGGVGGSARDLYPSLAAALVPLGLPEAEARPPRAAPVLSPVQILPSLTATSATKLDDTGFFAGLFRSFETRRTEVRAKAAERLQRLQEVAGAELMDAEPTFHAAVREALVGLLNVAITSQSRYLEIALAKERETVAAERAELAPLVAIRDQVRLDLSTLMMEIKRIEAEQPALSVAATAAETASLSH